MGPKLAVDLENNHQDRQVQTEGLAMDAAILAETLQAILPKKLIESAARDHGVINRQCKLEIIKLVRALVLNSGSDDSGALADAFRRYRGEANRRLCGGPSTTGWTKRWPS